MVACLKLYASSASSLLSEQDIKSRNMLQQGNITNQKMGISRGWFNVVRRKFNRRSQRDIIIHHSPSPSQEAIILQVPVEAAADIDNIDGSASSKHHIRIREFSKDDIAAIKIQAFFRGHLARRAFRALKSLVKLQALVRGVHVRRQTRIAMHCMHALVRLQVRVRARQLLRQ